MADDPDRAVEPTSRKITSLIAMRHGGTHLIQPVIRHLTGRAVSAPKGDVTLAYVPGPKLVVFKRDPRNRMISHFRYKYPHHPSGLADRALAKLMRQSKGGTTAIGFMTAWADRWADGAGGHLLKFEDFMANPVEETVGIRDYLGAPGDPLAAVEYTLGKSGTWTGRHSRWQEWFGPESEIEWAAQGGDRLVRSMGYD